MKKHRFPIAVFIFLFCLKTVHAETKPCWVFFKDRGGIDIGKAVAAKIASPEEPKSVSRRARIMGKDAIFDERDLPVNPEYCEKLRKIAGKLRTVTRYFNGVSVDLNSDMIEKVKALPFVKQVKPVKVLKILPEPEEEGALKPGMEEKRAGLSYGNSFDQVNMVGAIDLHKLGYLGGGITIAVLDSGFDNLEHTAFDSISVSNKRDFVEGDDDPGGDKHGSEVLSIMAALDHGNMIGTAPYAGYILARTEIRDQELRAEEDRWVAGIEWADSLGADIVNSSLGYTEFDDGEGYTYEDLDGKTAITTVAADIAVAHGIVVVTSAGNKGNKPWHYVTTPADGFDVLAIGGVDSEGEISSFSSRGPTYDGRIKPDFVALAEDINVINSATPGSYIFEDGTSYSSPAVSGAIALILEVNRSWGPEEVRNALISTASPGEAHADTVYGYGMIDALAASGLEKPEPPVAAFKAYNPYPQPLNFSNGDHRVFFPVDIPSGGSILIKIFNFSGENINTIETAFQSSGIKRDRAEAPSWDGTNFTGDDVAPGIYYYKISFGYGGHTGKIAVIR